MPGPLIQSYGGFSYGKKTQTAGTVITRFVAPYGNQAGGGPLAGTPIQGTSNRAWARGVIHVTDLQYQVGTTAHTLTVMRPLNYTTFSADAAASQAVVNVTADPGLFQTAGRYQYGLPNGLTAPKTANNAIAGSDFCLFQCADGSWVLDTVSSVSGLAVTMTTSLPTGGVKAGGLFYWFGITTDTDPATGEAHPQMDILAAGSGTATNSYSSQAGLWCALHPGDPLVFHSSNLTTAGTFEIVAGYYASH